MEVQQGDNLHFLVEGMVRWRVIIGDSYEKYKSKPE
jgi:hypothetical protein